MRVYLVRHGEAKSKDEDPERGLTEQGRLQVEAVGRLISRDIRSVGSIWHSGKKRAAETAEILAGFLPGQEAAAQPVMLPGLSPEDPPGPIAAELRAGSEDVLLVGHLPFLDRLALLLIGADSRHVQRLLAFEPAAALCLERREEAWLIAWFVSPPLGLAAGSGPVG
ncbi:MAG: phosphohistidine phosphatase SixA [Spirochaetales bacterium]|nr:phosphohistidine phosphatase SixA [Spirochaetales bacterium]